MVDSQFRHLSKEIVCKIILRKKIPSVASIDSPSRGIWKSGSKASSSALIFASYFSSSSLKASSASRSSTEVAEGACGGSGGMYLSLKNGVLAMKLII